MKKKNFKAFKAFKGIDKIIAQAIYWAVGIIIGVAAIFYFFKLDPTKVNIELDIKNFIQVAMADIAINTKSASPPTKSFAPANSTVSGKLSNDLTNVLPKKGVLNIIGIDVGQGDCTLIVTPDGKTMMIDFGEKEYYPAIDSYLKAAKIKHLDVVLATHPHSDHIGSMRQLMQNYDVGKVYMPQIEHDTYTYLKLLKEIKAQNRKIITAKAGVEIPLSDEVEIEILHPQENSKYDDINNLSAVLKVNYGDTGAVLMGDAGLDVESELLKKYPDILQSDILKVGHHGSSDASGSKFLKAVDPKYALIYVGEDNSYYHPHSKVIDRIKRMNVEIMRTNLLGTIAVYSDGQKITTTTQR